MRYLVLSDIHANLEALEAVLADGPGFDQTLVLGDVIGYGADPNAVVDRLRAPVGRHLHPRESRQGRAPAWTAVGGFNHLARQAIQWTASTLTPDNHAWVAALGRGPVEIDDLVEISHGSPFDEDAYIFDELDVRQAFTAAHDRSACSGTRTCQPPSAWRAPRLQPVGPPRGTRLRSARWSRRAGTS